ncbi:MAG: TlpA family protein disulfide reductase [Anaerolineales bacterium]|jgi:cytochrome c biogenesis protein CcmG/thiol:disulfide interchange protein DsbE
MKKILLWGGILLLFVVLGVGLYRSQQGQVGVGEPAPDFELQSFSGETYRLADLEGSVIVVNFWASWCESCKPEAKDLEAAYQYYLSRGDVIFLGVDYVDTEPEALAYLEEFEITYPNGPDLRTEISQAFRIRGVPETFVIDQNGKIAHLQIGPFQSLDHILSVIDPLLD